MRICHLITSSAAAHYFESHARAASAAGHEMLIGSLREVQTPAWVEALPRVEYFSMGVRNALDHVGAFGKLVTLLRRRRVDVLQTHLFHATALGVPAGRLGRVPLVIAMRHHIDDMLLAGAHLHSQVDRQMARAADVIVVPSRAARDYLVGVEGHPPDKVEVINIGWDFDQLASSADEGQRTRESLGIPPDAFVLGCIARLSPNKGHRYLLESVAALRGEIPNVRVLLVGDGDRAMVEADVARLALGDHVIFAGYRQDVPACVAAMDVMVLPSLSESFNQAIVEAMGGGAPVIATRVGGAAEVIEDGRSGLLVAPRDVNSMTAAIRRMHRDPVERAAIAAGGHATVTEKFTAARMTHEQLDCYVRGLAKRGRNVAAAYPGIQAYSVNQPPSTMQR